MNPLDELDRITEEKEKAQELNILAENLLINQDKEETKITLQFARALLSLDLEIKDLKEDQKEIKNEAKDNGVSVAKVTKALNALKTLAKTKEVDLAELEEIEEVLGSDVDIKTQISELVKK